MKVLFAASEGVPFCKTGGLADVVGSLSLALAKKKHSVLVVLPYYRRIRESGFPIKPLKKRIRVPIGGSVETVDLLGIKRAANVTFVFLRHDHYFDRDGFYGERPSVDFDDNDRRFMLYSRGVLEAARALKFKPDVVHSHDWQAGLVSVFLKKSYARDRFFHDTGTVFTIHNMAYQGNFSPPTFALSGLPPDVYTMQGAEFWNRFSYLKAGLVYADAVNTVSPTYAREIASDARLGCGMDGVLRSRGDHFLGITNGLDVREWDPAKDSHLAAPFKATSLRNRAKCKEDLQYSLGFRIHRETPVLGFVGRLDPQKGVDLLLRVAPELLRRGVQLITLGVGHPNYVHALRRLQAGFSTQMHVETGFAEPLAHKVYGGCDLFLMPSSYEPCGLGQLIAMRYGAIPVVTPTGGLTDTVVDQRTHPRGTGFISPSMSAESFLETAIEALEFRFHERRWAALVERAMSADHSWKKSTDDYVSLYRSAKAWRGY